MEILKEFKSFVMRGNVVDMAIGVIIGTAFGKIVTSMVNDVLMPPIGYVMGGVDFRSFAMVLSPKTDTTPEVALKYGLFINNILDFLIVAAVMFLMIKLMNRLVQKEAVAPTEAPKPSREEILLAEIRDLLKNREPHEGERLGN